MPEMDSDTSDSALVQKRLGLQRGKRTAITMAAPPQGIPDACNLFVADHSADEAVVSLEAPRLEGQPLELHLPRCMDDQPVLPPEILQTSIDRMWQGTKRLFPYSYSKDQPNGPHGLRLLPGAVLGIPATKGTDDMPPPLLQAGQAGVDQV